MESRCRTRAPGPAPCPARSLALLLLLLLLLPRPVGETPPATPTPHPGPPPPDPGPCPPQAAQVRPPPPRRWAGLDFPGRPGLPRPPSRRRRRCRPPNPNPRQVSTLHSARQGGVGDVLRVCGGQKGRGGETGTSSVAPGRQRWGRGLRSCPLFDPSGKAGTACGFSSEKNPTLWDPEAMVRRWPWMVSVQANGTHLCAGTLIASHWVLTAAHCLTRDDINYTVRVGSPWINQTSQVSADVPVLQVILNSKFQPQRYWSWVSQANNIGLLELQPGLNYSKYVQPACLPGLNYTVEDGAVCIVTGWGLSQVDGTWPQFQTIQEKEVTVLKRQECEDFYHRFLHVPSLVQTISPEMMCVTDPSRGKFCCELSGEPLVCSPKSKDIWYLVGLVTWGPGCQEGKAPPIFLRVSSYTPWILDRLNQQPPALPAPSRVLLLALPLSLSLLAAL
ncbi:putative threonine protease PRSS50 [Ctenodactylus gundi]